MTNDIPAEVVPELIRLVAALAERFEAHRIRDQADALLVKLDPAVDPDLIEARKIAADNFIRADNPAAACNALDGMYDDQTGLVSTALAALKRGRELAKVQS